MSSGIAGRLGSWDIEWLTVPRGLSGEGRVRVGQEILPVAWRKDHHGVWLEFAHGVFGFDLMAEKDDEGRIQYRLKSRTSPEHAVGLHFTRAGEAASVGGAAQKKKAVRVRAQMPGKIIKLMVNPGDAVEKDQVLLVMEAMKMENPIKAPQAGRIARVAVAEGQAVETGADLVQLGEP
jgi:biotin carboxyl carrier protein